MLNHRIVTTFAWLITLFADTFPLRNTTGSPHGTGNPLKTIPNTQNGPKTFDLDTDEGEGEDDDDDDNDNGDGVQVKILTVQ